MTTLSDLKRKLMKRPEFRQEYEKVDAEFQLIGEDALHERPTIADYRETFRGCCEIRAGRC